MNNRLRQHRRGGLGALVCALALLVCTPTTPSAAADAVSELALKVGPATRLLVLAPHPDDEVLGAAGVMQRVLAAGGSVRVVLMTSGDAFPEGVEAAMHIRRPKPRDYRGYGDLRDRETIIAMKRLGIDRSRLLFLGFPDGGLCQIASTYLSARTPVYESPYTDRICPPSSEQIIRGVTYRGADIGRELERVLVSYRPNLVVLPHNNDQHPDHCATYIFGREALDEVAARDPRFNPRVLQYLIHADHWPLNPSADLTLPLQPPAAVPPNAGAWQTLTLTAAETAAKQSALSAYGSQMLVMRHFLEAFGRSNELFVEGRPESPSECWCDATKVATEPPRRQTLR